ERSRENVLFPAPAMPVTTMRLPTMGGVSISLTALKNYLSTSLTMEKKSNEVERRLSANSGRTLDDGLVSRRDARAPRRVRTHKPPLPHNRTPFGFTELSLSLW